MSEDRCSLHLRLPSQLLLISPKQLWLFAQPFQAAQSSKRSYSGCNLTTECPRHSCVQAVNDAANMLQSAADF